MPRLTQIAETHFREVRKLAPSADLKEAGFDFPDNRFRLNDKYGFAGKSLIFFYNDYEVGPPYMGATEVEIPIPKSATCSDRAFLSKIGPAAPCSQAEFHRGATMIDG
jgi:hypothetical protein